MSPFLHLLMFEIRLTALAFLFVVYIVKIIWLFRFGSRPERTFPAGSPGAGVVLSLLNVFLPWEMESTRKNPLFYAQFALFHLGVAAVLLISFIIPFWPALLEGRPVVWAFRAAMGIAALVGLIRFARRLRAPALRLISTWDDYISLATVILYLALGVLVAPNRPEDGEGGLIAFFVLTVFLELYAPFSKIGHYLFYPFTRFFLGRNLGHRGVLAARGGRA